MIIAIVTLYDLSEKKFSKVLAILHIDLKTESICVHPIQLPYDWSREFCSILLQPDSLILTKVELRSRASKIISTRLFLPSLLAHSSTIFSFIITSLTWTGKAPGKSAKFHVTDVPSFSGALAPPVVKYPLSFFGLYTASNTSLKGFLIFE